jgi:hypothetical protein
MSLSMYQASVPVFVKTLGNLSTILDKANVHATAKKIDPAVLLAWRLAPDMLSMGRQIQIAADMVKGGVARLAGMEPPSWPDDEVSVDEFKARIQRTISYCNEFQPAQIDGSEARDVTLKMGGKPVTFKGQPYLLHFVLPNFFFHVTTAYDILRQCGVEIGKRDFLGV